MATEIKTIQIAPSMKEIRCYSNRICARWVEADLYIVYTLPETSRFEKTLYPIYRRNLREAIMLSSRSWQIENLLNNFYNVEGGKVTTTRLSKKTI